MATQKQPIAVRAFDKMCETLDSGVDIHRCVAATAMAKLKQPGAVSALIKALMDQDEDVRTDVVDALAELNDPMCAEAVMENFVGDPCPEVKMIAIKMLCELNHKPIIPHLLKLIDGDFSEINWDESEFYATGWDDTLEIQVEAIRGLGVMGVVEAVPKIIHIMGDELGQDVTHVAIMALCQLKGEGLAALEELMKEGDAQLRRRICKHLELDENTKSGEMILACLKDQDGSVRYAALEKIIELDSQDHRLNGFYDDEDADVRQLVVETIGARLPAKINQMLSDRSPMVRQAAFRAIAATPEKFEKEGFSEVVRQAIVGVPEVAADASIAWAALIGEPSADSLGTALQNPNQPIGFRMGLIEALTLLDDAGFPYLAEAAGDENRQVRVSALTALAEISRETSWPNTASETLLAALSGDLVEPPEEPLEDETTDSGDEGKDDVVAELADDEYISDDELPAAVEYKPVVEKQAVSTLEQMMSNGIQTEAPDDPEEDEEEVVLDEEDERFIEISKMRAMKKGKVSLDVKIAPHQDVRRFAARLLGDFDDKDIPQSLVQALEVDDDELKQACLDSLSIIGESQGKLKKSLYKSIVLETEHADRGIRMAATRCLGFITGKDVVERLYEIGTDTDVHVRLEAFRALGRRKDQTEAMIGALQDDYSGVRTVAIKALGGAHKAMDELIELSLKYDSMHRGDIVDQLKQWNAKQAAEIYLNILKNESRKRDWLVSFQAIGDLLSVQQDDDIQAVA